MSFGLRALIFFLVGGVFSAGAFDPPRSAFPGSEIGAALKQAKQDQRAVLLMYYDYENGQESWKERSMEVLADMEGTCVVVYVDSSEMKQLTPKARQELSGKKLGSTYPRAVIMDASLSKLVFPMPQKDWAYSFDSTMRSAKREAMAYRRDVRRQADKRDAKIAEAAILESPVERTWTDTQGRSLQATLNYIETASINVTRDNGLRATIMLDQLSETDHDYLEIYAGSLFDKRGL